MFEDLAEKADAAVAQLRDAAEDVARAGLQALVDLGAAAQERLDAMGDAPEDETVG